MSEATDFTAEGLCSELGIKIVPCAEANGPNVTKAQNVIGRLIADHGAGHATIVLRTIVESEGNADALRAHTILAVSDIILAHPHWAERGLAWIEAFDSIPLSELAKAAKGNRKACPQREAIATMIYAQLRPVFNPAVIRLPRVPKEKFYKRRQKREAESVAA